MEPTDPLALMASFYKDLAKLSNEYAEKLAGKAMPLDADGKKKKRKKRIVDPNAPKRPQSAYVRYLQDTRPTIVQENPDLKQTEIMAKIGNLWSGLETAKKAKYQNTYEKELKKWEKANKKYLESKKGGDDESKASPTKKPAPEVKTAKPKKTTQAKKTTPKTPEKKKNETKGKPKAEKKKKKSKAAETPKKKERGTKRKAAGSDKRSKRAK